MFQARLPVPLICVALLTASACSSNEPQPEPAFELKPTIPALSADPLAQAEVSSCAVYQEDRCEANVLKRCDIYDPAAKTFVDEPDPLLHRVYLYDRWYDLYHAPQGLTSERVFNQPMPGDTAEEVWTSSSAFAHWDGFGDAPLWMGAALLSDTFRYANTKTEADYKRMEKSARGLVRNFEVTGVPGYLARHHALLVPPGSPQTESFILHFAETIESFGGSIMPLVDAELDFLPEAYRIGLDDGNGGRIQGQPIWNGDPSIDQYTGALVSFPIAYNLLKDEALKERMAYHLTCYLKRLERIEVVGLRHRPELLDDLRAFLAGSNIRLDPGDPDITDFDRIVFYALPGMNRNNQQAFLAEQTGCPDRVQTTATRVLDGRDDDFELKLFRLFNEFNREARVNDKQLDHFYLPTLRGGDASHLIQLAAISYYFTGDEQYRRFLFDDLLRDLSADRIAQTTNAVRPSDFCIRYYADHITYGTHWQLITMLPDGELKDAMIRVMEDEFWQKGLLNHSSAKFNLLYATTVPDDVASDRDLAIRIMLDTLHSFGGNDGNLDAPRRDYARERSAIIDQFPAGTTVRCPTETERAACETGGSFLGIPFEGESISYECDGRAGECMLENGRCAQGIASDPLPMSLRQYGDFVWQRSPFRIGDLRGNGRLQSPGRDLTEPYWMARYYGLITEGEGQVLAWRDVGACP